ncbi:hypothetical protein AQ616_17710 [Oceanobacillus sp. E9]|uniref:phage tail protein n=1 Tax=Oceanobacillus sp. E9 TaxID=1742575 RepID=UPI00084EBC01|nr:phage tail protein [Oceanobacillus sp. E9]OEH53116.1 hypothetical protein AQ616_17710 [Oceanobacillus sp. E9]
MERANVYIFDDEDKLLHVSDEYVDDESILEEDIDNDSNNLTVVFPYTADACDYIEGENQIVVKDLRGVYRLWTIKEVEDVNGDEGKLKMAICMPSYVELNDAWVYERRPQDMPINDVLDVVLDGTRFERGRTGDYGTRSTSLYYQSVTESLKHIRSVWGGEYIDRVEFDDHGITGRFIDWERRGVNNGKRFEIDKDIQSIRRTVLHYPKTAFIGRGGSVEVGAGNSRKITFEDVEWNVLNGDPVDKPKGQKYVGDPEALESYGIKTKEGKIHRIGIYDNDDITDPEELLQVTWDNVQKNNKPQVKYEMAVRTFYGIADYEHEQVYLGDTGYIIDEEMRPALTVQSRVIKISYSIGNPSVGDITVGNFLRIKDDESKLDWVINKVTENSGSWDSGGIVDDDSFPNVKPPAPENLQATGLFSSIMLKWDYDPSVYIAEYRVYGSTNANFVPSDTDNFLYATKSGGYAHDAEVNEQWYFVVCAVNTHGQRSDFSQRVMVQTKQIDGNTEISEQTITKELLAQQAMIDEVHLNNAIITDAHINGRLTANVLMIGDGALYDDGYDPSDKADKTYVDNAINNLDFEGADNLLSDTKFERFAIDGNEDQWRFALFGTPVDVQGYQQRNGAIGIYVDIDGSVRLYSPPFIQELDLNKDIIVSYEARIRQDTIRPYFMGPLTDNLSPAQYSLTNFLTDELPIDDEWTRYIYKIPAGTLQGSSGRGYLGFFTSWDTEGRRDIHIKRPMVIQSSNAQGYRSSPEDQIEEYTQKKYNLLQNGSFNIGKQGWDFSNQYANARTTILEPESDKPNAHIVHINQQIYNGLYSIQNNRYVLSQAGNFFTLTLDVKFDEIVDPTTQDFRIIRILTSPNTEDNLMKADGIRFSNPAPSTWSNVIMFSDVMDQHPNLQAGEWATLDFEILITQRDIEDWWGVQFLTTGWIDDDQTIRSTDYYIREVMLVNGGIPKQFAEDPTSLWAYRNSIYMDGGSLYANSVTANEIAAGTITANSGIIANAAITNAMIQEVSADKLMAGTVIAEDVTIKGKLEGVSGTFSGALNSYSRSWDSSTGVYSVAKGSNFTSESIASANFLSPYEMGRVEDPDDNFAVLMDGYSLTPEALTLLSYTAEDMYDYNDYTDDIEYAIDRMIVNNKFRSSVELNGNGLTFTRGGSHSSGNGQKKEAFSILHTLYRELPTVEMRFQDDPNIFIKVDSNRDMDIGARGLTFWTDGGPMTMNVDSVRSTARNYEFGRFDIVEQLKRDVEHPWSYDLMGIADTATVNEVGNNNGSIWFGGYDTHAVSIWGRSESALIAGYSADEYGLFRISKDETVWQLNSYRKIGMAMYDVGYLTMGLDVDAYDSTSNNHLRFNFIGDHNDHISISSNTPVTFTQPLLSGTQLEAPVVYGEEGYFINLEVPQIFRATRWGNTTTIEGDTIDTDTINATSEVDTHTVHSGNIVQNAGNYIYLGSNNGTRVTDAVTYTAGSIGYKPIRASSFPTGSSILYKQNIEELQDDTAYMVLDSINPVTYNINSDVEVGTYNKKKIGAIMEMSPEIVRDEDGLDYNSINMSMVKVIKSERNARIKLEKEIENLYMIIEQML